MSTIGSMTIWLEITNLLEAEKERLIQEIVEYPFPIPACDAQYNYLLEQRTRINQELRQARNASAQSQLGGDLQTDVNAFIESSDFIDAARVHALFRQTAGHSTPI